VKPLETYKIRAFTGKFLESQCTTTLGRDVRTIVFWDSWPKVFEVGYSIMSNIICKCIYECTDILKYKWNDFIYVQKINIQ